jgi:small basic protein
MYIWTILTVVTLILLAIYWSSKNAVWGGLTVGIIIGILWKFVSGTDWYTIVKVAIVATLLGFGFELLGMLSDHLKKKS